MPFIHNPTGEFSILFSYGKNHWKKHQGEPILSKGCFRKDCG